MRKTRINDSSGFTLFEVIVVLLLMGILAVGLSVGLVRGIEHYIFAQQASEMSQKAQLAMARIKKELTDVTAVTYISSSRIDYTRPYLPPSCLQTAGCQYRIQQVGNNIYLEGISPAFGQQTLIEPVAVVAAGRPSFLTFRTFGNPDAAWTLEVGNKIDNLAKIIVSFQVMYGANQTMQFDTTVNPRPGIKLNIPRLN